MFDDVPENLPTGNGPGVAPSTPTTPTTPTTPEVPVAEPVPGGQELKMPEGPEDAAKSDPSLQPKDMFASVDDAATPSLPSSSAPVASSSRGGGVGKIIIIVLVAVIVLGGIGFAVAYFMGGMGSNVTPDLVVTPEPVAPASPAPAADPEVAPFPGQPIDKEPPMEVDSDGDGLTDEEEARYGTSSRKPDTDNDDLFDREEVEVYNTNPLSPDTDGDGYLDGEEVANGFNPNGPGSLFDAPSSATETESEVDVLVE